MTYKELLKALQNATEEQLKQSVTVELSGEFTESGCWRAELDNIEEQLVLYVP